MQGQRTGPNLTLNPHLDAPTPTPTPRRGIQGAIRAHPDTHPPETGHPEHEGHQPWADCPDFQITTKPANKPRTNPPSAVATRPNVAISPSDFAFHVLKATMPLFTWPRRFDMPGRRFP